MIKFNKQPMLFFCCQKLGGGVHYSLVYRGVRETNPEQLSMGAWVVRVSNSGPPAPETCPFP